MSGACRRVSSTSNMSCDFGSPLHPLSASSVLRRRGLRLSKWMPPKESPHLTRGMDAVARGTSEPFRQRRAARPGMASSNDGVEHDGGVVSTVRVFEAGDISSDHRFDGVRCAPVSSSPIRRPCRNVRKPVGGHPRQTAAIRSNPVGRPMKRNHRHRSLVCAPAPRQE